MTRSGQAGQPVEQAYSPPASLLEHHGDAELAPSLVDLAVNVRSGTPPSWLTERLAEVDLASYPDQRQALRAVADRHRRRPGEVLLTAGASEAFVLIARALRPRHAVVVHPQFTEPEVALVAAGHPVERVVLPPPFTLDAADVPDSADLVVIGNPTNPTSRLHPAETLRELVRPGRTVVVDEAFYDCVPGEVAALADSAELSGLIMLRSLTKTWGLAGIRAGYLLAEKDLITALGRCQPRWPVSSIALQACVACCEPAALAEAGEWAVELVADRDYLLDRLAGCSGIEYVPDPAASFVLLRSRRPAAWDRLRARGFAARRGDTFPGLGPNWLRVAVRDQATTDRMVAAMEASA